MRYALDSRNASAQKYWKRFRDTFSDRKEAETFFDLQRTLYRMSVAVQAHNSGVVYRPAVVDQIKELPANDFGKIFELTLEKDVLALINPSTSEYPYSWDLGF